jgi:hypothetical protein
MARYGRFEGYGWGPRDGYGRPAPSRGYDRGVHGGDYEGYRGGYPPRGRGHGWGGYGRGFAYEPFLPDAAYGRHPELRREPGPRGDRWGYERDDVGADLDDRDVRAAVRRRIYDDVWLDVDRIDVEVEDGVVTLRGEVDDWMEARYAWDDAWETEGVRGVVSRLMVVGGDEDPEPHGDLLPQTGTGARSEP